MDQQQEFSEFAFRFFQDLDYIVNNENDLFDFVLSPFEGERATALRIFIDNITQNSVSDEELQSIWRKTQADIVFKDGAGVRAMLKEASRRLAYR